MRITIGYKNLKPKMTQPSQLGNPIFVKFKYTLVYMHRRLLSFFVFFASISAVLRAIEFMFVALRSGSLAGQFGMKIISPNFGEPLLFTFEIFEVLSTDSDNPYVLYYSNVYLDFL